MENLNEQQKMLVDKLNEAAKLVMPLLEEQIEEAIYVAALSSLLHALKACTQEEITECNIEPEICMSLGADKNIMQKAVAKEPDQISLLSTLVVYTKCHREGMPNHSRIYMDQVTAVRKHIDHYYNKKVQKFCGS